MTSKTIFLPIVVTVARQLKKNMWLVLITNTIWVVSNVLFVGRLVCGAVILLFTSLIDSVIVAIVSFVVHVITRFLLKVVVLCLSYCCISLHKNI